MRFIVTTMTSLQQPCGITITLLVSAKASIIIFTQFIDHSFIRVLTTQFETIGLTRLNVYAGLAGFYILYDDFDTGKPESIYFCRLVV